jgi:hypothetical protein
VYKDGNTAFIVCRNGHIKNMDTSVWGPDTDGISRVSAQEDTVVHRVYMAVKIEETIYDDVQRHSGGFSSTTDNGQCGALSFEECFDEDSTVDISIESHEVALQQDSVQESQHLAGQLKVREDMIRQQLDILMIHTHWWQDIVGEPR